MGPSPYFATKPLISVQRRGKTLLVTFPRCSVALIVIYASGPPEVYLLSKCPQKCPWSP